VTRKILITTHENISVISSHILALSAYQAAYALDTKHNQVRTIIIEY
jgi:hypothetical protein